MDEKGGKQSKVTFTVAAGLGMLVLGIFLFLFSGVLFIGIGKVLALLLIVFGVLVIALGIFMGWGEAFGDPSKKPIQRAYGVYVIAKVIADKKSNPIIDPEFYDPDELKYLVQFDVPNRGKIELEAAPEVFNQVGEGMNGDIIYQGRWLSQFTFRPRASAAEIGEDPFRAGKL